MPQPPPTSLLKHYLFENPWPLGLVLLGVAAVLLWVGTRDGVRRAWRAAGLFILAATVVFAAAGLTTTSGEHAERTVRRLVGAVVTEDVVGGMQMFSLEAVMNAVSPQNPGVGYYEIQTQFERLASNYAIESNSITDLRAYSAWRDEAEVHMGCRTAVEGLPTLSRWIVRVKRDARGQWMITKLTCVSINNQAPPIDRPW